MTLRAWQSVGWAIPALALALPSGVFAQDQKPESAPAKTEQAPTDRPDRPSGDRGDRGGDRGRGGFGRRDRGGQRGGIALVGLLRSEQVRQALNITPDEEAFLELVGEDTRQQFSQAFSEMRDLSGDERRAKFQAIIDGVEKQVTEILGPERMDRLRQIQLQMEGTRALQDPDVSGKLQLSEEQKERLKAESDSIETEIRRLRQQKMRLAMEGVFTPDQLSTWRQMTGDPVDISLDSPSPGGMFFGRGGPPGRDRGSDRGNRGERGNRPSEGPTTEAKPAAAPTDAAKAE